MTQDINATLEDRGKRYGEFMGHAWKRRDLQLLRAAVFVMWPVLGAAGLVVLVATMSVVWLLIPFARVIQGEDGYVLTLFGKELK